MTEQRPRLRITFVLGHANYTGGVRVATVYADRLRARGHDVQIVSLKPRNPSILTKFKWLLKGWGWPHSPTDGSHCDHIDVPHHVISHDPPMTDADVPNADVVVATWWETAEWVARFSESKGEKVYFVQGYEVWQGLPTERVEATYRAPMQKIVVSRWLADVMRDLYGDDAAVLVPNSVDVAHFRTAVREKNQVPTVGFLYSSAPMKGVDVILDAIERARRAIPDLKVRAFGHGKASKDFPLPRYVAYEPEPIQDRLPKIYAECDAWLFGSRAEGFGLPILEAMACRTPVIATPAGAAPELLSQGGGILVGSEDAIDMANAIERICRLSGEDWRDLSEKAYKTAASYTWDDAADRFEQVLFDVVDQRSCKRGSVT